MNRPSKRFTSTKWSDILVPAILVLLTISLLIVLAVVGLSLIGFPLF
jgi:hypothetical protein